MADEWHRNQRNVISQRLQSDDEKDAVIDYDITAAIERLQHVSPPPVIGGSRQGRAANVDRERVAGNQKIVNDYFGSGGRPPTYPDKTFRRRFRMRRELFLRIVDACVETDDYFRQKHDTLGNVGLSPIQKITAALRMCMCTLGIGADATDEYIRLAESTANEAFHRFCAALNERFGDEYLRGPNAGEVEHYLRQNDSRGFPGMFGSLDCTHWDWKNCPVQLQGQYQDRHGNRSIIMETIATHDLRIWHAFIGMSGSKNDLNVLHRSPLLVNMLNGTMPTAEYVVNGHRHDSAYLLVDGIYPCWPIFQKPISEPQGERRVWYTTRHEAVRKDVERCFGVHQARFHILANPARTWDSDFMVTVWRALCILHNMIIEDEFGLDLEDMTEEWRPNVVISPAQPQTFNGLLAAVTRMNDRQSKEHETLLADLVEHLWTKKGEE
eukprot:GHVU01235707.1.p1 GENE.GHVU01235707.1~~GHVU01235707.1.p1  ORF type:complete len:439 (-),score=31.89 GHVU01235707.1:98-1414(-)